MNSEPKHIILDASVVIAILAEEQGHEAVLSLLPKAVMSSVNVAEVAKFLIESKNFSKNQAEEIITSLIENIVPFDTELAISSSAIIHQTKNLGLSLGDRACLALGLQTKFPIYTADKVWRELTIPDLEINLIR